MKRLLGALIGLFRKEDSNVDDLIRSAAASAEPDSNAEIKNHPLRRALSAIVDAAGAPDIFAVEIDIAADFRVKPGERDDSRCILATGIRKDGERLNLEQAFDDHFLPWMLDLEQRHGILVGRLVADTMISTPGPRKPPPGVPLNEVVGELLLRYRPAGARSGSVCLVMDDPKGLDEPDQTPSFAKRWMIEDHACPWFDRIPKPVLRQASEHVHAYIREFRPFVGEFCFVVHLPT